MSDWKDLYRPLYKDPVFWGLGIVYVLALAVFYGSVTYLAIQILKAIS